MSEEVKVERKFLSCTGPFLGRVARNLIEDITNVEAMDLAHLLCLVPTRQSGRRLREALAIEADKSGRGISPPQVTTMDSLLSDMALQGAHTINDATSLWCMAEAIRKCPLHFFKTLFPGRGGAGDTDFAWRMAMARSIRDMRRTLGDDRLSIADIAEMPAGEVPEASRWQALAAIEKYYLDLVRELGFEDPLDLIHRFDLRNAGVHEGIRKVIVIGVPSMLPSERKLLTRLARKVPVKAWVLDPLGDPEHFDAFGCPSREKWIQKPMHDYGARVEFRRSLDTGAMLESVKNWVLSDNLPVHAMSLGVIDQALAGPLESDLQSMGIATYNPAGEPLSGNELYQIVACLKDLSDRWNMVSAVELARFGVVAATACPEVPQMRLLALLDRLRLDHLVDSLDDVDHWIEKLDVRGHFVPGSETTPDMVKGRISAFFEKLGQWVQALGSRKPGWSQSLLAILGEIYSMRRFNPKNPDDRRFSDASREVLNLVNDLQWVGKENPQDAMNLLVSLLANRPLYTDRRGGDLDLLGWMELLWEPAPHLALVGFQDGVLPETITADIFLPEKFRSQLGLPSNKDRMARDTYIMHCLAAVRHQMGSLSVFFADQNAVGDPQRPSRLNFLCDDADLPARVLAQMGEDTGREPEKIPSFDNSWKLRVPDFGQPSTQPPQKMAVTSFSAYLACPFRFYLERIVGMSPVDRYRMELDYREFGHIFHSVLEDYGRDDKINAVIDPKVIAQYFEAQLNKKIYSAYGRELPASLWIQFESLLQRLKAVAEVEAANRTEGWQITGVEVSIQEMAAELGHKEPWSINNMLIAGTIDRVEKYAGSGKIRLIDFKTSSKAINPVDAHTSKFYSNNPWHLSRPEWQRLDLEKEVRKKTQAVPSLWQNLQLPLYAAAWQHLHPDDPLPGVAYFNVPSASRETGVNEWNNFSPEVVSSAVECAASVIQSIRDGKFWPPNPKPEYEMFPEFFIQDASRILEGTLSGMNQPAPEGGKV